MLTQLLLALLPLVSSPQDCYNPPWPVWCSPPAPCQGYVEDVLCLCLQMNQTIYDLCMSQAETIAQEVHCNLLLQSLNDGCFDSFAQMALECCTADAWALRRRELVRRIRKERDSPLDHTPQASILDACLRVRYDRAPRLENPLPPL